jgi:hypothetical protein
MKWVWENRWWAEAASAASCRSPRPLRINHAMLLLLQSSYSFHLPAGQTLEPSLDRGGESRPRAPLSITPPIAGTATIENAAGPVPIYGSSGPYNYSTLLSPSPDPNALIVWSVYFLAPSGTL